MKKLSYSRIMMAIATIAPLLLITGCKKFIDVPAPTTNINAKNVFESDATAAAALTGIYTAMSQTDVKGEDFLGLSVLPGLSADELILADPSNSLLLPYYRNTLKNLQGGSQFWRFYSIIFSANASLEGLSTSNMLSPAVKRQLLGEAKFIRALHYFYLVNLYGDVPLALTSDYKVNAQLGRAPQAQVYQQIIADLTDAQSKLSDNYLMGDAMTAYPNGSEERVRPTKAAATALLARVYLYYGNLTKNGANFKNAEDQATTVISNPIYSLPADLNSVFLKNSSEAIWQLQPVLGNTSEALLFILPPEGVNGGFPVFLSSNIVNAFEPNDKRKIDWISNVNAAGTIYYYSYKYKINTPGAPLTEYSMILRLAEQYLIRAEARAQQNNLSGAVTDLNVIRNRAGLPNTGAVSQSGILSAILQERKVELFTEYGHRWLDLKRTGEVNQVMPAITTQKGGTWNANWALYPIPLSDLNADPNLTGHQNPGY